MEIVKEALAKFGAKLDKENYIVKNGKTLSTFVVIKGKRLRFENTNGLIASGPVTVEFVSSFVIRYWFWELKK